MKTTPRFPPHSPSLRSLSLPLVPLCLHVDTELLFPLKTSYTRGCCCCCLPCGQSFVKLYFDFFVLWLLLVRTEEDSSKVNRVNFFSLSLALSSSTIRPPSGFFFLFFSFCKRSGFRLPGALWKEKKEKRKEEKKKETSFSLVTPYSSVLFGWPSLTVTSLWPFQSWLAVSKNSLRSGPAASCGALTPLLSSPLLSSPLLPSPLLSSPIPFFPFLSFLLPSSPLLPPPLPSSPLLQHLLSIKCTFPNQTNQSYKSYCFQFDQVM